jgi:hypothetical protein
MLKSLPFTIVTVLATICVALIVALEFLECRALYVF